MADFDSYRLARQHLDGTTRAARDAEAAVHREHERLANSGQLYPVKSMELGHEVTRYHGDIAATFAPFMAPPRRGRIINPRRGGGF